MIYIITGVSRGLGKAIALHFLNQGHQVIGVGRSNSIEHENMRFESCDMGDLDAVKRLFNDEQFQGPVTLINNAGIIGDIARLSDQASLDTNRVLTINTIAPMELTKVIYDKCNPSQFSVVNISSGAALRAIPSWASYCASKAALNMLSETFLLEEREKGNDLKVYAVAPGVVDTDMQLSIRETSEEHFSSLDNFKQLHSEGMLVSPEEAASLLDELLQAPYDGTVVHRLAPKS